MTIAVHIVHAGLGVGKWCFTAPAIRQHAEPLIDETLVPQCAECPHHTFHVGHIEGLVVVLEVNPTRLSSYVAFPLIRVTQHTGTTRSVELVDSKFGDTRMPRNTEFFFSFNLSGKPVAIPTESTLDTLATHCLVTRHSIFHISGEKVTVVWQTIGERGSVIEDKLVFTFETSFAGFDRCLEGPVSCPIVKYGLFQCRKVRLWFNVRVRHGFLFGYSSRLQRLRTTKEKSHHHDLDEQQRNQW